MSMENNHMEIKDINTYCDQFDSYDEDEDSKIEPKFSSIFCLKTCEGLGWVFNGGNDQHFCDKYRSMLCSTKDAIIPRCRLCVKEFGV